MLRTYPQLRPAPVGDDVVDVPVVAQAQGGTAHKGTHVQGKNRDEQGLSALQVTVKQDGDKNNLRDGRQEQVRGDRRHQQKHSPISRTQTGLISEQNPRH